MDASLQRVDASLHQAPLGTRNSAAFLRETLLNVLENLENETELFETLLCSMPHRFSAVRDASGGHTDY